MIKNRRYIVALFGESRGLLQNKIEKTLPNISMAYHNTQVAIYSSSSSNPLLEDHSAEDNNRFVFLHGVAFPQEKSVDLGKSIPSGMKTCLQMYSDHMESIPLAFENGSYVLISSDLSSRIGYAYTSFLNTIPLYYTDYQGCLLVSTDLKVLAKLRGESPDDINKGLLEYYALGTNLTTNTGVNNVHSLPKGAWISYKDGRINTGFYHILPKEEKGVSFNEWVERFSKLWSSVIDAIQTTDTQYGLGLTGGIDSRLILAGMSDRKTPIFYTGSNPDHPDWILAKYMTERMGLKNHIIEDYTNSDKLRGYAEYCSLSDNPLHVNHMYFMDKLFFRKKQGIAFELIGLTELLGGVYHYRDRRSYVDTLRMCGPLRKHPFDSKKSDTHRLIILSLRNHTFEDDLRHVPYGNQIYRNMLSQASELLVPQLGEFEDEESFLERFRHIHKMANLLVWSHLANRRYLECFSPSMNLAMTDFACSIPLRFRESRKLLFAYLNRFHPELAAYPLSGYIFTPQSPWILFKLLAPQIKALNHLGIKIPWKQWYIQKSRFVELESMPQVYIFQKRVCKESPIVRDTFLWRLLEDHPHDHSRLMRCFNLSVFKLCMDKDEEQVSEYLKGVMEDVISTPLHTKVIRR